MRCQGGTYYFLDRAMGPLMGTIGGLGSWIAVVFKSAFALVGMGAYLGIYLDLPFTVTYSGLRKQHYCNVFWSQP